MTNAAAILTEARDLSAEVAFAQLSAHGDHADCGRAWVVVKPARGAFVKHLKANSIGFKHHSGGWAVPVCQRFPAQSRFIFEKACDAFVKVLEKHGIYAFTYSYAD